MSITEEGYQFCKSCNKDTLHTPKLGLVLQGERLCTECRTSNKYKDLYTDLSNQKN